MLSLDAIKPVFDVMLENVKQRVNLLLVDPFGCWNNTQIPFDKVSSWVLMLENVKKF